MRLHSEELQTMNKLHQMLKSKDHKYLAENEIFVCRRCRGTGFHYVNYSSVNNAYVSYNMNEFCDTCHGLGYIINNETYSLGDGHYICKKCLGKGCDKCNNIGIIDWITNVMGVE